MRRLFSKTDLRDLSVILAIVMLLVSIPSTAGLVIVSGSSQPVMDHQYLPAGSDVRPRIEHIACPPGDSSTGVCSPGLGLDRREEVGAISRYEALGP